MTIDEAIGLLKTERMCVRHADVCDRNCHKCVLVQDTDELLEMYDSVCDWLEQLKEYQQLEEQGRLIKLPCKVGDTVYAIYYTNRQYVILSHVVSKFVIMPYRFPRVEIYFENENGFSTSDFLGQLNEDLFLTRAEAEAKLKELREEQMRLIGADEVVERLGKTIKNSDNLFLLDMHEYDQLVYNEALNDLVKRLNKKVISRKGVLEIVEDLRRGCTDGKGR